MGVKSEYGTFYVFQLGEKWAVCSGFDLSITPIALFDCKDEADVEAAKLEAERNKLRDSW